MQQTANYNLNLPEGTDVVNPLVDYNPNFTVIDGAMKANADRTVGRATCVKSGTTHVVTRSNTGSNIINFTATGDWNTGDTMTIDSTIVSVFLPDGSAALDGAYLINTEVFGILNGTRFTLYTNAASVIESSKVSYDNTGSGLTATNVQDAIDEIDSALDSVINRSTSEHAVGKWLNGETLYEMIVDFGTLPNATSKAVPHNISDLGKIVKIEGVTNYNDTIFYPLPYVTNTLANQIQVNVNRTSISINTGADYSEWTAYITLRYTKRV